VFDPHLRRALWLTAKQRKELQEAAIQASQHSKADPSLCESLLTELHHLEKRLDSLQPVIKSVIRGLKLPIDALPVYISHAEVQQVCRYGKVSAELNVVINPPLRRPKSR